MAADAVCECAGVAVVELRQPSCWRGIQMKDRGAHTCTASGRRCPGRET